jgi:hypothetical protein
MNYIAVKLKMFLSSLLISGLRRKLVGYVKEASIA